MSKPTIDFMRQTAREAGMLLLTWFEKALMSQTKSTEFDLVTEADKASESLILKRIHECYPGHAILAEESGAHLSSSPYRWIVDPLDGTTNFAHGFAHFCVTMAVQEHEQTIMGVTYDPMRDELFWAVKGEGAWLQSPRTTRPLQVSSTTQLNQALLGTGFPYSRAINLLNNVVEFNRVILRIRGIRRGGSAGLDLAYVAAGRLSGFWEYHLNPWDVAAGALMITEAGGQLCQINGAPWHLHSVSTVTANPAFLPILQQALNGE